MPTFIGTPREFKILIDSLSMPVGVTKADRGAAESLRERLQELISAKPQTPPKFKQIRASWPTGFVKPERKVDWAHHKPQKEKKVYLNNSTTQLKIQDVLDGLI